MGVFEIRGGPVTHRHLMKRTKWDLVSEYLSMLREYDRITAEVEQLKVENERLQKEVERLKRYAAYCNCCAKSGEHDLMDFDAWLVRSVHPGGEQ